MIRRIGEEVAQRDAALDPEALGKLCESMGGAEKTAALITAVLDRKVSGLDRAQLVTLVNTGLVGLLTQQELTLAQLELKLMKFELDAVDGRLTHLITGTHSANSKEPILPLDPQTGKSAIENLELALAVAQSQLENLSVRPDEMESMAQLPQQGDGGVINHAYVTRRGRSTLEALRRFAPTETLSHSAT